MAAVSPTIKSTEPTQAVAAGAIPPLENGDRLTRAEFERRYDAMPGLKKAELIEGEVHMPSPVRQGGHSHVSGYNVTASYFITGEKLTRRVNVAKPRRDSKTRVIVL